MFSNKLLVILITLVVVVLLRKTSTTTESDTAEAIADAVSYVKIDDLCVIKDIECYLNCDTLSVGNVPCQDKDFQYKCTNQYCSKNENKCRKFQSLTTISKLIKSSKTYEKKIKNFNLLKLNLKHCNIETFTWNILKNKNVKNENCNSKQNRYNKNSSFYMIKIAECSIGLEKMGIQLCKNHKTGCGKLLKTVLKNQAEFYSSQFTLFVNYYLFIIFLIFLIL